MKLILKTFNTFVLVITLMIISDIFLFSTNSETIAFMKKEQSIYNTPSLTKKVGKLLKNQFVLIVNHKTTHQSIYQTINSFPTWGNTPRTYTKLNSFNQSPNIIFKFTARAHIINNTFVNLKPIYINIISLLDRKSVV